MAYDARCHRYIHTRTAPEISAVQQRFYLAVLVNVRGAITVAMEHLDLAIRLPKRVTVGKQNSKAIVSWVSIQRNDSSALDLRAIGCLWLAIHSAN